MARSIGEAIATGIDTGFSRVQQYRAAQDAKARQDKLDEERTQSLGIARQRQADADAMAALNQQEKLLQEEEQGVVDSGVPRDQGSQQDFAARVRGLRQARGKLLAKAAGGMDFTAAEQAGKADLEAIASGKTDPATLGPGQLARAATVATGRDPKDYIRPAGGMAPIEKASMNVLEGLQSNDMGRVISGLNVLHAPELSVGVGSDSPHGKIVAKQIINVVPDPNSGDPENPRVIPVMRVFVNSGKDFRGPVPPGMPEGSTGYYDAPLTQNRSSDPNDPVKSVGVRDFMQRMTKQLQAVEVLNTPQVLAKLQEDEAAWNPAEYLQARASVGVKPTKSLTTTRTPIPAGGSLLEQTTDASGRVVGERRIEGNAKPVPQRRVGTTQEKIDAIDGLVESGVMTEEEGDAAKKGVAKSISTARPGGRGGSGSNPSGTIQSTKVGADGYMVGVFRDGSVKQLLLDGKPIKAQDYAKRVDKLASDIGKSVDGIGKSSKDLRAEAEATLATQAEPAPAQAASGQKAAPKVLKFDKQGNLVK